jgi:hypothetical protein
VEAAVCDTVKWVAAPRGIPCFKRECGNNLEEVLAVIIIINIYIYILYQNCMPINRGR